MKDKKGKAVETLTFVRMATMKKDGQVGRIYRHAWATGYQDLVFTSAADVQAFIDKIKIAGDVK